MKKFIKFACLFMFAILIFAGCSSPMIEVATSNNHIEGGFEGHSNLWNALYKDGGKDIKYGDGSKADYISYQITPTCFAIEINKEIPEDAPTGIQMLTMAPKNTIFIKVLTHENGKKTEIENEVSVDELPANVYESKMSENKVVFVLDYMGVDKNNDGKIDDTEKRIVKEDYKATVAFYDSKGKKIGQESFDVKIKQNSKL